MDQTEALEELGRRIVPRMQEHGLTAFVILGYFEAPDGKRERVCIANTMNDPVYIDALRPILNFGHIWGANSPIAPVAPKEPQE